MAGHGRAPANVTEGTDLGDLVTMGLPMLLLLGVFYFLLIRPENKRKKELSQMRADLKVGDEITTIGGIVGTICASKEQTIVIETGADRVRVEVAKWAVSTRGVQTTEQVK